MAEFPNTNPFNGYSIQWTQPYLPTSYNPFYEPAANTITQEMAKIEQVDSWVDSMLTYPDAERIINKIRSEQ